MKVSKTKSQAKRRPVKAGELISPVSQLVVQQVDEGCPLCDSTSCYSDAVMYIRNAINALSACAKNDEVAKDSIANLSVVLFDLKGDA